MHALWYLILLAVVGFCVWRVFVMRRRSRQMRAEREAAMAAALATAQKAAGQTLASPPPPPEPPAARPPEVAADVEARAEAERIELEAARRAKAQKAARAEAERRAALEEQAREAAREEAAAAAARQAEQAAQAEEAALAAEPTAPVAPPTVKTPSETLILMVDDSKMVRIKTTRLLEGADYRVVQAVDGQDAVRQLETCQPDLVITDVDMPNLDGFGLVRHLRGNARTADIPIVMITSAEDRHREGATREGVGLVLGKPYPEDVLLAHIRSFRFTADPA